MRAPVKIAGAVVLVAYAALIASVRSFTWPALVLTAIAGIAVLVLATRQREPSGPTATGRGVALWGVLAIAVIAWELLAYVQSPRDAHPTISSLVDTLEAHRPLRGALFIGWVAFGRELARR